MCRWPGVHVDGHLIHGLGDLVPAHSSVPCPGCGVEVGRAADILLQHLRRVGGRRRLRRQSRRVRQALWRTIPIAAREASTRCTAATITTTAAADRQACGAAPLERIHEIRLNYVPIVARCRVIADAAARAIIVKQAVAGQG